MKLSYRELLGDFDAHSLEKGRALQERGHAKSLTAGLRADNTVRIDADVRSERGNGIYFVEIGLDSKLALEYSICSCPVGSLCKHGVAVLLSFWLEYAGKDLSLELPTLDGDGDDENEDDDEYGDEYDDDFDESLDEDDEDEAPKNARGKFSTARGRVLAFKPELKNREIRKEPDPFEEGPVAERIEVLDLSERPSGATDYFLESIRSGGVPRRVKEGRERWELVFAIGRESEQRLASRGYRTYPELHLYKALRYIKKTGEAGRIKAWVGNCLTEEPDELSIAMVRRFASSEETSVPLAQVADLIFKSGKGNARHPGKGQFPLFMHDGKSPGSYSPITVARFESLSVSFVLHSYEQSRGRVLFLPVHGFDAKAVEAGAPSAESRATALWAGFAGPRLLLVYPGAIIAWTDRDEFINQAIARFLSTERGLERAEIVEAERAIASIAGDRLRIDTPPTRLERRFCRPRVGLDLDFEREAGLVAAKLRFIYDGYETKGNEPGSAAIADGVIRVVERDIPFEARVRQRLSEMLEKEEIERWRIQLLRSSTGADFFFRAQKSRFLLEGLGELVDKGIVVRISGIEGEFRGRTRISAGISVAGDWFEVRATARVDGAEFDIPDFDAAIGRGFATAGGKHFMFDVTDSARFAALLDRWDAQTKSLMIGASDFGRLELAAELADATLSARKDKEALAGRLELAKRLRSLEQFEKEPLPAAFSGELRPYQKTGYDRLCFFEGKGLPLLLADDMGLGKTIQTLAFLLRMKERGILGPAGGTASSGARPVITPKKRGRPPKSARGAREPRTEIPRKPALLVAPVTLLHNWEDEARRFAPDLVILRHHGTGRAKEARAFEGADIISTSYQTLRVDLELFRGMSFSVFVMDEAHNIKNPASGSFAAVKAITSDHRLSLTGTPVENRPLELWAQFEFLSPGLLGNKAIFERRFGRPIAGGTEAAAPAAALLKRLVSPFILRRRKEEVLKDLPPKEELVRRLDMGAKQASVYEKLRQAAAERVRGTLKLKGAGRSAITVFEALLRLRQAAIHPGLVDRSFEKAGSVKLDFLAEAMEELRAEGHRVLVFSQFVQVLKRAEAELERLGISYEYLDGQTRDRRERIASFKSGSATAFLLSLKAGGAGINLPEADYVILLDPWWNPAVESQAIDRAHRIGQTRKVTVLKPIAIGTVEEKMLELQDRKKAMVRDLVAEDGAFYAALSEEEIMDLFE